MLTQIWKSTFELNRQRLKQKLDPHKMGKAWREKSCRYRKLSTSDQPRKEQLEPGPEEFHGWNIFQLWAASSSSRRTRPFMMTSRERWHCKRILYSANVATENVQKALGILIQSKSAIRRPDDFYAEMIKNDNQMRKVKSALLKQQVRIQNF